MPMQTRSDTIGAATAAGALIACLIGAGFASGQEVLQFFTAYGPVRGLLGAALATGLLGGATALLLTRPSAGAPAAGWLDRAAPALLFGVYALMLAGAGALVQTGYGLPAVWGRAGMLLATLFTVLAGLDRMTGLLGRAGPLIVAFVLAVGAGTLLESPAGSPAPLPDPPARSWWMAALVYAGYNLYLMAPFLRALGDRLPGAATARRAAWLGCGVFGGALALLHLAFCQAPGCLEAAAPTVALAQGLWPPAVRLAVPVLLAGVYTTAAPLLFSVCGQRRRPAWTAAVALAGFGCSALPFGRLIGLLTPLIGWFGLVLAAGALAGRLTRPGRKLLRPDRGPGRR